MRRSLRLKNRSDSESSDVGIITVTAKTDLGSAVGSRARASKSETNLKKQEVSMHNPESKEKYKEMLLSPVREDGSLQVNQNQSPQKPALWQRKSRRLQVVGPTTRNLRSKQCHRSESNVDCQYIFADRSTSLGSKRKENINQCKSADESVSAIIGKFASNKGNKDASIIHSEDDGELDSEKVVVSEVTSSLALQRAFHGRSETGHDLPSTKCSDMLGSQTNSLVSDSTLSPPVLPAKTDEINTPESTTVSERNSAVSNNIDMVPIELSDDEFSASESYANASIKFLQGQEKKDHQSDESTKQSKIRPAQSVAKVIEIADSDDDTDNNVDLVIESLPTVGGISRTDQPALVIDDSGCSTPEFDQGCQSQLIPHRVEIKYDGKIYPVSDHATSHSMVNDCQNDEASKHSDSDKLLAGASEGGSGVAIDETNIPNVSRSFGMDVTKQEGGNEDFSFISLSAASNGQVVSTTFQAEEHMRKQSHKNVSDLFAGNVFAENHVLSSNQKSPKELKHSSKQFRKPHRVPVKLLLKRKLRNEWHKNISRRKKKKPVALSSAGNILISDIPFKDHIKANYSNAVAKGNTTTLDDLDMCGLHGVDISAAKVPKPELSLQVSNFVSTSIQNIKASAQQKRVDELMKSTVLPTSMDNCHKAPNMHQSSHSIMKQKRKTAAESAGPAWFNMPKTSDHPQIKRDLQIMKMRGILDPKQHYKKGAMKNIPKFCQVGTIVEGAHDFYAARVPKKLRQQTILDELLADTEFRKRNKEMYLSAAKGGGQKKGKHRRMKK